MEQIRVEHLSKKYGQNIIIDDVSFVIEKGEYVGLVGPNGAGKSTLLQILLGLIKPTSGVYHIKDRHMIGYVPQHYTLPENVPISVSEVIQMGLLSQKIFSWTKKDDSQIIDAITYVGLSKTILQKCFHDLSGGQKQRVIIARAMVTNPEILFFDEPLSGVDHVSKIQIYQLLSQINTEKKITILFVSHEIENIIEQSDRVLCLNKTLHLGCHPIDFAKGGGTCIIEKDDIVHKKIHHHHSL